MDGRHCGDRSCATDNSTGWSHNPNHGFREGVRVSVGKIVERSAGYSKTADPCPRNLKSIKFDVTFSTFISSSTETVGPSGRVVPDREVQRLDSSEEMARDGMGGKKPRSSVTPK
jgi:hypothetical protein